MAGQARRLRRSSATVRNVLARLEEQGFVKQPHTSAGRVPTDLGYRHCVDVLMQDAPARRAPDVEARLRQGGSMPEVLAHASHELARQTQHVGFAGRRPPSACCSGSSSSRSTAAACWSWWWR